MFLLCYREHRGAPDFFHAEKINFYAEKINFYAEEINFRAECSVLNKLTL